MSSIDLLSAYETIERLKGRIVDLESDRTSYNKRVDARLDEFEGINKNLRSENDRLIDAIRRCEKIDALKSRCLAAEARVVELERQCEQWKASTSSNADVALATSVQLTEAQSRIAELTRERDAAHQACETLIAEAQSRIAESASQPDSLGAVLEEMRADGIQFCIRWFNPGGHFRVYCGGLGPILEESDCFNCFDDAVSILEKLVIKHNPDSAFARRRREGATVDDSIAETIKRAPTPWRLTDPDENGNGAILDGNGVFIRYTCDSDRPLDKLVIAAVNAYTPTQPAPPVDPPTIKESLTVQPTPPRDAVEEFYRRFHGTFSFRPTESNSRQELHHGDDYVALLISAFSVHKPIAEVLNRYRQIAEAWRVHRDDPCSEQKWIEFESAMRPLVREEAPTIKDSLTVQPTPPRDAVEEFYRKYGDRFHEMNGGIVRGGRTKPDVCYAGEDAKAVCEVLNRYRQIAEAYKRFDSPDFQYTATRFINDITAIVRPLVREEGAK